MREGQITRRRGPRSTITAALTLVACFAARGAYSQGRDIRVAAASNLAGSIDKVAEAFVRAAPGYKVEFSFGSSGALAAQIRAGAPFDLFLSADRSQPERLAADGFSDIARVYAVGVLCIASRHGVDPSGALAFLNGPAYRTIAVAKPELAPYGAAAIAALEASGLADMLSERLVYGSNIGQAVEFVSSGASDAGFVSLSAVLVDPALAKIPWARVDPSLYPPIEQAGIVLRTDKGGARAFMDFILSQAGRAILSEAGYSAPGEGK